MTFMGSVFHNRPINVGHGCYQRVAQTMGIYDTLGLEREGPVDLHSCLLCVGVVGFNY